MKATAIVLTLLAAVTMALPAAEPAAEPAADALAKLERRGCAASCLCQSGQCYCTSCSFGGQCQWYYNGQSC